MELKIYSVHKLYSNTKNILVCQPWFEGEKRKHFAVLRIKWGGRLLAGKGGFCPQRVEKSSSRQLPKQHPSIR